MANNDNGKEMANRTNLAAASEPETPTTSNVSTNLEERPRILEPRVVDMSDMSTSLASTPTQPETTQEQLFEMGYDSDGDEPPLFEAFDGDMLDWNCYNEESGAWGPDGARDVDARTVALDEARAETRAAEERCVREQAAAARAREELVRRQIRSRTLATAARPEDEDGRRRRFDDARRAMARASLEARERGRRAESSY